MFFQKNFSKVLGIFIFSVFFFDKLKNLPMEQLLHPDSKLNSSV
jgi:hypothetical protein